MAYNPEPLAVFPSYASDGTNITIPIASVAGLTQAKAHPTTGDNRAVVVSILDTMHDFIDALNTADKPQKLFIKRSISERNGEIIRSYFVTVKLAGDLEIPPEAS